MYVHGPCYQGLGRHGQNVLELCPSHTPVTNVTFDACNQNDMELCQLQSFAQAATTSCNRLKIKMAAVKLYVVAAV